MKKPITATSNNPRPTPSPTPRPIVFPLELGDTVEFVDETAAAEVVVVAMLLDMEEVAAPEVEAADVDDEVDEAEAEVSPT